MCSRFTREAHRRTPKLSTAGKIRKVLLSALLALQRLLLVQALQRSPARCMPRALTAFARDARVSLSAGALMVQQSSSAGACVGAEKGIRR